MLYRITQFYGHHLEASDGDRVGRISDCYFDDRTWNVLFFSVDTDWWTPRRRVLVSPRVFGTFAAHGRLLPVRLTRRQIENGPALELNEPVTERHAAEYYHYYNWPFYWLGGSLWGLSNVRGGAASSSVVGNGGKTIPVDPHLRSARRFLGFPVRAGSEHLGRVDDLLVNSNRWQILFLAVNLSHHWFPPMVARLSTRKVLPVDWEGERIAVTVTSARIERALSRESRLAVV
jgi:hypothetical protein